jgi:hypothetical protein
MSTALPDDDRLRHARVALLDALIHVLHAQRDVAALTRAARAEAGRSDPLVIDPRPAYSVAAWTEQLQHEGLVSPGELCVMHQRAQAAVAARSSVIA